MKQIELYYIAPGIIQYKVKRKKKKKKWASALDIKKVKGITIRSLWNGLDLGLSLIAKRIKRK